MKKKNYLSQKIRNAFSWRHLTNSRRLRSSLKRLLSRRHYPHPHTYSHSIRLWDIIIPAILIILAGMWVAAFSLDSAFTSSDTAARNTKLGAYEIGGMDRDDIENFLNEIAKQEIERPVTLFLPATDANDSLGPQTVTATLQDLGIEVDIPATISKILNEHREGNFLGRLISWSESFVDSKQIEIQYRIGGNVKIENIQGLPLTISEPISANFSQTSPSQPLTLIPEQLGETVDVASISFGAASLVNHGIPSNRTLGIQLAPSILYPEIRNYAMRTSIRKINDLTNVGLDVVLGADVRRLEPENYREAFEFSINPNANQLNTDIGTNTLQKNIEILYSDYVIQGSEIVYSIPDSGVPEFRVEGENLGCCAPVSSRQIDSLLSGANILKIENKVVEDQSIEEHTSLEIRELVSEFTLNFPSGTVRATNIAIAANDLRGAVIFPGDRWSLNGHLGEPVRSNGYVLAEVLDSRFANVRVGGGVDVLATALFNAAFQAGLDLPIYQTQPVFVQGNPYGLSISLSWPNPGLIIGNPTPYGVLIWTEQTGSSVTIRLYSTKFFEEVTREQFFVRLDQCSNVITERTRKFPPGTAVNEDTSAEEGMAEDIDIEEDIDIAEGEDANTDDLVVDVFRSFYLPEYGLRCDGTLIGSDTGELDNGELDNGELDNGELDNGELDNGELDNG